jgi:dATP pyrophosphohydrolase
MSTPSERRPDAVAVAILRGAGEATEVLLVRRARGAFAGSWTVVMGGVEADERATATVRREVAEETGLAVQTLYTAGIIDSFYDPIKDRIVHVPMFVARVGEGAVRTDAAHDAHRWAGLDDAVQTLTFAAQRRLIDEVRREFVEREPEAWRLLDG